MRPRSELTDREQEILALVARGMRNSQIARELGISVATVENHLHHVFSKMGFSSRTQAALHAMSTGQVNPPNSRTAKREGNPSRQ